MPVCTRNSDSAEFADLDPRIPTTRIDNLYLLFERLFPHLAPRADRRSAVAWAARPICAVNVEPPRLA